MNLQTLGIVNVVKLPYDKISLDQRSQFFDTIFDLTEVLQSSPQHQGEYGGDYDHIAQQKIIHHFSSLDPTVFSSLSEQEKITALTIPLMIADVFLDMQGHPVAQPSRYMHQYFQTNARETIKDELQKKQDAVQQCAQASGEQQELYKNLLMMLQNTTAVLICILSSQQSQSCHRQPT